MMVKKTQTVEIILLETGDHMRIEETDFDPVRHEMISGTLEIPSAIDMYVKNKEDGKKEKKTALVDTTKKKQKRVKVDKNKTQKVSTRRRLSLS